MTTDPKKKATPPIYQIFTREAQTLADLSGIKLDLTLARDYLFEGSKLPISRTKFALFDAAHIAYRRAFNRGPSGLTLSDVESLGAADIEMHHFHYNQANKLVAHSVNPFENCEVGVEIKDGRFGAVKHRGVRYVGLKDRDVEKWTALILRLEKRPLDKKINSAYDAIAEWLKGQQVSEIEKGPIIGPVGDPPPRSPAMRSRTRHRD